MDLEIRDERVAARTYKKDTNGFETRTLEVLVTWKKSGLRGDAGCEKRCAFRLTRRFVLAVTGRIRHPGQDLQRWTHPNTFSCASRCGQPLLRSRHVTMSGGL
jgi:hypothetical protein